jgi:hypothetical protein
LPLPVPCAPPDALVSPPLSALRFAPVLVREVVPVREVVAVCEVVSICEVVPVCEAIPAFEFAPGFDDATARAPGVDFDPLEGFEIEAVLA